jgi:hypothetical protein
LAVDFGIGAGVGDMGAIDAKDAKGWGCSGGGNAVGAACVLRAGRNGAAGINPEAAEL